MAASNPSTSPESEATLRAVVHGRVQGVGYRYFVLDRAARLNLSGTTRNLRDGTVEVEARGARASLEKLLEELRRGPALARVTDIKAQWDIALPEFEGFDVSY